MSVESLFNIVHKIAHKMSILGYLHPNAGRKKYLRMYNLATITWCRCSETKHLKLFTNIWAVIKDNAYDIFLNYFLDVFGSPTQSPLKNYKIVQIIECSRPANRSFGFLIVHGLWMFSWKRPRMPTYRRSKNQSEHLDLPQDYLFPCRGKRYFNFYSLVQI